MAHEKAAPLLKNDRRGGAHTHDQFIMSPQRGKLCVPKPTPTQTGLRQPLALDFRFQSRPDPRTSSGGSVRGDTFFASQAFSR